MWLRVRLCRLVYDTQVCEHWLCASYARLHDPTLSSPIDHEVGYAWLCSERFAPSTLPLAYGQLLRLREVHNRYRSGYAAVTGVVMPPGVHQRAASTGYAQVTHGYMTPL